MENNFCIGIDKSLKETYLTSFAYQEGLSFVFLSSIDEGIEQGIKVFFWNSTFDAGYVFQHDIFVFTDNYFLSKHLGYQASQVTSSCYFQMEDPLISFRTQFMIERSVLPLAVGTHLGYCKDEKIQPIEHSGIIYHQVGRCRYFSFPWRISQEKIGLLNKYRPFYSSVVKKFYCEVGPTVDYNILRRLIKNLLVYSFNTLGYPLVRRKNCMDDGAYYSIRIDADGFSLSSVETVLAVTNKTQKSFHWFIDVYSWCKYGGISLVKRLKANNQDVQIHSFRHMTFLSEISNFVNIWTASYILYLQGLKTNAVVSPFGFYNSFFQSAMRKLDLKYTSEFGFNVNDIATYPSNDMHNPLQVPTHNASITTLKMSNFTPDETFIHLEKSIIDLANENGFAILYEHPILGIEKYSDKYVELIGALDKNLKYISIDQHVDNVKFMYSQLEGPLYLSENSKNFVQYSWYTTADINSLKKGLHDYWIPYDSVDPDTYRQLRERNETFDSHFSKEFHSSFLRWFFSWYLRSIAVAFAGFILKRK